MAYIPQWSLILLYCILKAHLLYVKTKLTLSGAAHTVLNTQCKPTISYMYSMTTMVFLPLAVLCILVGSFAI